MWKRYNEKDCMSCANSYVDDDDKLRCAKQDWKVVDDNDTCEEWKD